MTDREGGARRDGGNERAAKRNKKGAGRQRRRIKMSFSRTVGTLLLTSKRLQQLQRPPHQSPDQHLGLHTHPLPSQQPKPHPTPLPLHQSLINLRQTPLLFLPLPTSCCPKRPRRLRAHLRPPPPFPPPPPPRPSPVTGTPPQKEKRCHPPACSTTRLTPPPFPRASGNANPHPSRTRCTPTWTGMQNLKDRREAQGGAKKNQTNTDLTLG